MNLLELAELLGGRLVGDGDTEIRGISQIDDVQPDEVTFLADEKMKERLEGKQPAGVIVQEELPDLDYPQIVVADPRRSAVQAALTLVPDEEYPPGIESGAYVDPSAIVDPSATIMTAAYVGPQVSVGARTVIMPQAYLGPNSKVGADCVLHPGTKIGARCTLGNKVICHQNVSIGADGFGYEQTEQGHAKVPQKGIVVVEDEVEIGACSCVDRATFGRTRIGAGTKIDNLVQIAHNCLVGRRCILIAQVGLAGSVIVGDDTILAGRVACIPHVRIGSRCIVGSMSAVHKDLPDGSIVGGVPCKDHMVWKRELVAISKLPEALKDLHRIAKRLDRLEKEDK